MSLVSYLFNFDTGRLFGEVKIHSFIDQVDFTKTKKQVMAEGHRYSAGAGCGLDVAVQLHGKVVRKSK